MVKKFWHVQNVLPARSLPGHCYDATISILSVLGVSQVSPWVVNWWTLEVIQEGVWAAFIKSALDTVIKLIIWLPRIISYIFLHFCYNFRTQTCINWWNSIYDELITSLLRMRPNTLNFNYRPISLNILALFESV